MKSFGRYAEYVPVGLLLVGFLLIGLGWNGAAGIDYTQGQIPYMISGGLMGLGFVFFGAASLVVQGMKRGQAKQLAELQRLSASTQRVASLLSLTADGMSANGHGGPVELVVAGAASFHLPECRLVKSRDSALKISKEEALSSGLNPCRICVP